MRTLSLALVAALSAATLTVTVATPADAKRPKADLVSKKVSVAFTNGKVSVLATVTNKGAKAAKASRATFYLSTDGVRDGGDPVLGTVPVRRIKAKKAKPASAVFSAPTTAASGTYRVVACADTTGAVKERNESNNCAASTSTVQITGTAPPATGPVTVSATAGTGGTVAASGITGGSCAATTCTFPTAGTGTVTFTPTANAGYRFGGWGGATCNGFTTGANGKITFTNPTSSKACTATFIKQVTISYSVSPIQVMLVGSVSGAASHGSCTNDPVTGGGSCLVDAGVGTVTLTATPLILPTFQGWTGTGCTSPTNPLVLTSPTTDINCTATFGVV